MTMKKPTISRKPPAKSAMEFIEGAGQELASRSEPPSPAPKAKKVQIPLLIPPALVEELDSFIAADGTGISRSSWICQAIREKLESRSK